MDPLPYVRYAPPPDIRHFRPPPNIPASSPYHFRQPSNPHVDYINLRRNLESQKNSSRINLNDSYIRDEGCKILADFLQTSPQIAQLELKGNNITSKGLITLLDALKQNFKLKSLNLEWNSIGLDSSGLEALINFLSQNNSLNHLDLRNNRITSNDASLIGNMIKSSKSLVSLDLRWNELGNSGGKAILASVRENNILQVLELSGNNVSEDIMKEVQSILDRNRQKYPFYTQTLNDRENLSRRDDGMEEGERGDFIKRLEKELNDERTHKMELQGKFDQEFQKSKAKEFELNKIIHELELKNEKYLSDNKNLRQMADKLTMELEMSRANGSEIAKINESKLLIFEKDIQESEKRHRMILEKIAEENELRIKEITMDSENKIRSLEDRNKELQSMRIDMENELKRAIETGAKMKLTHEDQIRELQYKLGEQENMRYTAHLKSLENRMKVLEESREAINKRNSDIIRDIKETESHRVDTSGKLEREVLEYKEENENLSQKHKELENVLEKFRTELKMKDNLIEKLEHEINELNEMIESFKRENKDQFQELSGEYREEVRNLQAEKDSLNVKLFDLQNAIRNSTGENLRLRHDYQRLADLLQSSLNRSVLETFSANNFI